MQRISPKRCKGAKVYITEQNKPKNVAAGDDSHVYLYYNSFINNVNLKLGYMSLDM